MAETTTQLNHPHLQQLLVDLEAVKQQAEDLQARLTAEQLRWKPAPDVWSIDEVFRHLIVNDGKFVERLEALIQEERQVGGRDSAYKPSLLGRLLTQFAGPRVRMKIKAPKTLNPALATSGDDGTLATFLENEDTIAGLIRAADAIDINRDRMAWPVSGLVRLTAGDALSLMLAHQQRHLNQALHVMEHPEFPQG